MEVIGTSFVRFEASNWLQRKKMMTIGYPVFTGNFIVNKRDIENLQNLGLDVEEKTTIDDGGLYAIRVIEIYRTSKTKDLCDYDIVQFIDKIKRNQGVDNYTYLRAFSNMCKRLNRSLHLSAQ